MKLSTRSRYGMRMMTDLAGHYGENPVLLKDIAKREDISEKYLSLIVIPLRGAGLLQSIRGAGGGYRLAHKPENITVRDIWQALEGEICLVDCVKDAKRCPRVSTCPTRDMWGLLGQKLSETLQSITLADLARLRREKADNNIMNCI
ncbi:MAG: Rrf2 family transcriptional regulator [Deltaproteobacteria bacterium]|nr:Rrf2 family transcriptional regulator [Deltaproteobacteria bacterium]